jgi:hypothetical protein
MLLSKSLARARVHSNILRATGPIDLGGNQGRDFETFKSQVAYPAVSNFKDTASDAKVVFGCCRAGGPDKARGFVSHKLSHPRLTSANLLRAESSVEFDTRRL